jgi:hypothetical protein
MRNNLLDANDDEYRRLALGVDSPPNFSNIIQPDCFNRYDPILQRFFHVLGTSGFVFGASLGEKYSRWFHRPSWYGK